MSEHRSSAADASVSLVMDDQEAHDVHHALSMTIKIIDVAAREPGGIPPDAPLAGAARGRLVIVAQRLDHERRHRGAVPNPNRAVHEAAIRTATDVDLLTDGLGEILDAGLLDHWNAQPLRELRQLQDRLRKVWNAMPRDVREEVARAR